MTGPYNQTPNQFKQQNPNNFNIISGAQSQFQKRDIQLPSITQHNQGNQIIPNQLQQSDNANSYQMNKHFYQQQNQLQQQSPLNSQYPISNNSNINVFKDDYHMQNVTRLRPQPKQIIIDYKQLYENPSYNMHYTVGQNYKKDLYRSKEFINDNLQHNTKNKLENDKDYEEYMKKFQPNDAKYNQGVQQFRNSMVNPVFKQNEHGQYTHLYGNQSGKGPNSQQNLDDDSERLYYNYKKYSLQHPRKNQSTQFLKNNIFEEQGANIAKNQNHSSLMNYKSINYDPINFSQSQLDRERTKQNIFNPNQNSNNNSQDGKFHPQFGKGGSFQKYLDELKISSINSNPIFNEKYEQGKIDFKLQNGDFTQMYDNCQFFGKPFKKFR